MRLMNTWGVGVLVFGCAGLLITACATIDGAEKIPPPDLIKAEHVIKHDIQWAQAAPLAEQSETKPPPLPGSENGKGALVDGLQVVKLAFGKDVDHRQLQQPAESFAADGSRIYAYLALANGKARQMITVDFKRDDRVVYSVRLPVGRSNNWRTWATYRAHQQRAGEYAVAVRDQQGNELAQGTFSVIGEQSGARADAR